MMRKPYSACNYDDPVEYLSLPPFHHAPLQTSQHILPVVLGASHVTFTVEVGPTRQSLTVIVRPGMRNG